MSVKEKSSKLALDFPLMGSAPALITSGSEPVSTADYNGALASTFSVSTATANTNVSTSNTAPTTSQVATENHLSVMEKSIASLGDTLTRFIQSQKRPSSGTSIRQRHRNRSRDRDRYSYYKRSRSRSPQTFNKNSRHQHGGGWSPSLDLSLNASQSDIDDEYEERSQYRDKNNEDEQQQGDGNHEDVDNLLTLNHQTAVSVPSTMSTNSAESDLLSQINSENLIPDNVGPAISGQVAEVAKRY